jgi:hypothetical protein
MRFLLVFSAVFCKLDLFELLVGLFVLFSWPDGIGILGLFGALGLLGF